MQQMATADQSRVWFTLDAEAKPVGPYTVEELVGEFMALCRLSELLHRDTFAGRSFVLLLLLHNAGYATSGYVSEAQVFWKDGNAGWQKAAEIADLAAVAQALQQYRQQHPNSNPAGYVTKQPRQSIASPQSV